MMKFDTEYIQIQRLVHKMIARKNLEVQENIIQYNVINASKHQKI